MSSAGLDPHDPRETQQAPAVGATRRFSLAAILAIVFLFAVLFGLLSSLGAPPWVFAGAAAFVTAVGLGQAYVFGGRRPREASLLTGSLCLVLTLAVTVGRMQFLDGEAQSISLVVAVVVAPLLGGGLGYLIGALIGGAFLVADRWTRKR
jgi:hypothetical protein